MTEEKKKKVYTDAINKYRKTEKGKEMLKKSNAKSQAKKFILELADDEDIEIVKKWLLERENKKQD